MSFTINTWISDNLNKKVENKIKELNVNRSEYLRSLILKDLEEDKLRVMVDTPVIARRGNLVQKMEVMFGGKVITKNNDGKFWNPNRDYETVFYRREQEKLYGQRNHLLKWDMFQICLVKTCLDKQDNNITKEQMSELADLFGMQLNPTFRKWLWNIQQGVFDDEILNFNEEISLFKFHSYSGEYVWFGNCKGKIPKQVALEICVSLMNMNVTELAIYKKVREYVFLGYDGYTVYCICMHYQNTRLLDLLERKLLYD